MESFNLEASTRSISKYLMLECLLPARPLGCTVTASTEDFIGIKLYIASSVGDNICSLLGTPPVNFLHFKFEEAICLTFWSGPPNPTYKYKELLLLYKQLLGF